MEECIDICNVNVNRSACNDENRHSANNGENCSMDGYDVIKDGDDDVRIISWERNGCHHGRHIESQGLQYNGCGERSVLKHLLTEKKVHNNGNNNNHPVNRCDRVVNIDEVLSTMCEDDQDMKQDEIHSYVNNNNLLLCHGYYCTEDAGADDDMASLGNGYYENNSETAQVIHSPKSAQTLSQLNGSDDINLLLDDVSCVRRDSHDYFTSQLPDTSTLLLDADSSVSDSFLTDVPSYDCENDFMDCEPFDEVLVVDRGKKQTLKPVEPKSKCSKQLNVSANSKRLKCSRRKSQGSQEDEKDIYIKARERKLSMEQLKSNDKTSHVSLSNGTINSTGEDEPVRCRLGTDPHRIFLEDHRYSSRKLTGGVKSLVRSGSHDLPLFSASQASTYPRGPPAMASNTLTASRLQNSPGPPTSALESFLRARQTFNPNRGSDALLTAHLSYPRAQANNKPTTPTTPTKGPSLSRSTSVPSKCAILGGSSPVEARTHRLRNASQLLHRLLTDELDAQDFPPFSPDGEIPASEQHSMPEQAEPCGIIPAVDIDKELANEAFDYATIFTDDLDVAFSDEDDDVIRLSSSILDEDLDHLFDKELENVVCTQLGNNRTNSASNTSSNGQLTKQNGGPIKTKKLQQPTSTTTQTAAADSTTQIEPLGPIHDDDEEREETWFMKYFDNLF